MGAVNSTTTDLAVDVATAVTQQTNTSLDSTNNAASSFVATSGCTINVTGNLITDSQVTQASVLSQYGTTANNADVDTAVSQQMLQNATSSLSGLALGFSGNFTSASATVGVSSAVNEITQQTLTSSNNAQNLVLCSDGASINIGGDWSNVNTTTQSVVAVQVGNSAQTAAVSTAVDQSVSQTTSASLVGLDFNVGYMMIIAICVCAVVLLLAPLGMLFGLVKHLTSFASLATCGGMVLFAAGLIGCSILSSSFRQPCNAHSQCRTSDNPTASCSCIDQYACGITDGSMSQKSIGVSSPPIQWLYALNEGATGLFAASLRRMAVRSFAGSDNTSVVMNNSGYNIGTYVAMKKYLLNKSANIGGNIGAALVDFMVRKVGETGDFGLASAVGYVNCVDNAADMLIPVQPYNLAMEGETAAQLSALNSLNSNLCLPCNQVNPVILVEIPSNFVVDTDVAGCLPKIFIPSSISSTQWSALNTPCATSSQPPLTLSSALFTASCKYSACYADGKPGWRQLLLPTGQNAWCYFGVNSALRMPADPDPHSYLATYNDISTFSNAQTTQPRKTLWYMLNRMMSATLIYSNHRADQFALLGFSTFMNSAGMDDAGAPAYPLTQQGLAAMEDVGLIGSTHNDYSVFVWYAAQPLLVKENGAFVMYTLRDIYLSGKLELLKQINTFVFKQSDWTVQPSDIALGGLASADPTAFQAAGATGASPTDALAKMSEFGGTVVGGFGVCNTWWSSDAWIAGTASAGVGLFVGAAAWMIARLFVK